MSAKKHSSRPLAPQAKEPPMATAMRPDVVLLDLHMPDESVVEPESVKSQLRQCGSKVLAMSLSSREHDEAARALAESFGAVGLLDKTRFGDELIPAILDSI
jgi:CheY-like chemotaxis protein